MWHWKHTKLKLVDGGSFPHMRIQTLPPYKSNALRFEIEIRNDDNKDETVTRTGRDVVNAVLKLLSWIARVGVPVQTSGRPSAIEAAKGGLLIIADTEEEKVWAEVGCLVCLCVLVRARARARIVVSEPEAALLSSWGGTIVPCLAPCVTRSLHGPPLPHTHTPTHNNARS